MNLQEVVLLRSPDGGLVAYGPFEDYRSASLFLAHVHREGVEPIVGAAIEDGTSDDLDGRIGDGFLRVLRNPNIDEAVEFVQSGEIELTDEQLVRTATTREP